MTFCIQAIILWPARSSRPPRVIRFKPGAINILSGENSTGKTAIVYVLEYCLGQDGCSIPKQPLLRDAVSWYGVIIGLKTSQMLIARRSPGTSDDKSDDYFMLEGPELEVPSTIVRNSIRSRVMARLAEISGIQKVNFVNAEEDPGREEKDAIKEVNFFDTLPFCLIPNDTLVSPYDLFYMKNVRSPELKRILPLAIGAIDDDMVQLMLQIQQHRRLRNELRKDRDRRRDVALKFMGIVDEVVARAVGQGLMPADYRKLDKVTVLQHLEALLTSKSQIVADAQVLDERQASPEQVAALADLRMQEARINTEIGVLRAERNQLAVLQRQITEYRNQLIEQRDRATGISWFGQRLEDTGACPTCGSETSLALQEIRALGAALNWLRTEVDKLAFAKEDGEDVILSRMRQNESEERRLLGERRKLVASIRAMRQGVPELGMSSLQSTEVKRAELFALLELVVTHADDVRQFVHSEQLVSNQDVQIRDAQGTLKGLNLRQSKAEAVDELEHRIAKWAQFFDVARSDDEIKFVENALQLKFVDNDLTRKLSEIGASVNFMGYHIALFLALHESFRESSSCPVAPFLLLDSPSVVDATGASTQPDDQHGEILRRVYTGLDRAVREAGSGFQIIVTERPGVAHLWDGLRSVYVVQDWERENGRLVPDSWAFEP